MREGVPLLARLFPPGSADCGEHEWFRADERTDRCWHCTAGVREHRPVPIDPDSPVWQALNQAARGGDPSSRRIVLRRMSEHEAYEAMVANELGATAASLNLDATTLRRQAAGAADVSRSLAAAAQSSRVT
jgi:hypothetical protein